jgi:hypothetical protein
MKTVTVKGRRVRYASFERHNDNYHDHGSIVWSDAQGREVAYVSDAHYQSPAAARFSHWLCGALFCAAMSVVAHPDQTPAEGDSKYAVRVARMVDAYPEICYVFITAAVVCALTTLYYVPETCRALRAGIGRLHRLIFGVIAIAAGVTATYFVFIGMAAVVPLPEHHPRHHVSERRRRRDIRRA